MNKLSKVGFGLIPHHSNDNSCLCTRDTSVYRYIYATDELEHIFTLPYTNKSLGSKFVHLIKRSALRRRLAPSFGISHAYPLDQETLIVLYDKIYLFNPEWGLKHFTLPENIAFPLHGGIAYNPITKSIYFGEYINDRSKEIRIFSISLDGSVEMKYQFRPGEIKHIHSMKWDIYENRMWINTGDSDEESAFFFTDNDFITLEKFNGGDQSWRAVSILPFEQSIIYGTDAGKDARKGTRNYIYSIDRNSKNRAELLESDKPFYHGVCSASEEIYIGQTYEPGQHGILHADARLLYSEKSGYFKDVFKTSYKKRSIRGCTKYAHLFMPSGKVPNKTVIFTPVNTQKYNFMLCVLRGD